MPLAGSSMPPAKPRDRRRDALGDELDVPSGDTLAAELTRFLREHEERRRDEAED